MNGDAPLGSMPATEVAAPRLPSRQVAASSVWLLADSAVRILATTVVFFWIARELGPERFGVLNFASALGAIFVGASALGLEMPAVLRLARGGDEGEVLATLLALRAAAALISSMVAAGLALMLQAGDPQAQQVALICVLTILASVPAVVDYAFKARVRAGAPARARTAAALLGAVGRLAVLQAGLGLPALAWVLVAETLATSGLLWQAWWREGGVSPCWNKLRRSGGFALLREGLPYLGLGLITLLYVKADLILLGTLGNHLQTGLYTLTQKMSEVLYVVPVVLADSLYPSLARRTGASAEAGTQLLFDLAFAAAFAAVAIAVLLAPPLVSLLFGEQYAEAGRLFRWHAWTCIPAAFEAARLRWLATIGAHRLAWVASSLGAVVGVSVNLYAIPRFGVAGAVGAALAAYAAMGLLAPFLHPALRPVARIQLRALWPWGRLTQALRRASES